MGILLDKEKREKIFNQLTSEQKEFIQHYVKRGKKTAFANVLAKDKGIVLPLEISSDEVEILLDEWILVDYIDNGFVNKNTPCECGKPLRYQYIVMHKSTKEKRRFGINHFEEHTGIPSKVVKEIKAGFEAIDYEKDELLSKISNGWRLEDVISNIPEAFELPKDVKSHLNANIPLLDRQIKRVNEQLEKSSIVRVKRSINDSTRDFQTLGSNISNNKELNINRNKSISNQNTAKDDYEMKTEAVPFMLFPERSLEVEGDIKLPDSYNLPNDCKDAVIQCLENGVTSTRVICELLIKYKKASSKRYSTGRPRIYPHVCLFLDSLVNKGTVIHTGSLLLEDRYYKLVNNVGEVE